MGVDFGVFPPEVNSGLMYAGPGAGSMLAAVAAWQRLAGELGSVASGYESVIAGLTGQGWSGPAAESMAAAAAPFVVWLSTTAVVAEQAAIRLGAAVGAFEEAYAAMVPPSVIEANRCQLASLIAGNVLGHNGAAIAATEAQYVQMWTQDAAVMSGYAVRSAAAATLTSFAEPPATASSAGLAGQATAVGQATAGGAHTQLSQLLTAIPQLLRGIAPAPTAPLAGGLGALQATTVPSLTQLVSWLELAPKALLPFNDANIMVLYGLVQFFRNLNIDLDIAAAVQAGAVADSGVGALTTVEMATPVGAGPTMSGSIGNAGLVGKLSVPPGWVDAAPAVKMAATAVSETVATAAPTVSPAVPAGLFADMALASMVGRTIAGTSPRGSSPGLAAVMNGRAPGRLERMVNELAGTHEVQHWHVDPSRLDSLLEELSEKPGVHAVHVNDDGQGSTKPPRQPG